VARRGLVTPNRAFALALVVLFVTTFLPSRLLGWTDEPGKVVQRLISPPADVIKFVADQFSSPEPATNPNTTIGQIDTLRGQNLALQIKVRRLQQEVAVLSGATRVQNQPMRLITASIIAESSDPTSRTLRVRAGMRDGIRPGSVATTQDSHLLGRITNLDQTMCDIVPITDKNAGTIEGITTAADGTPGLRFDLTPQGDGTLKGPGRFETDGLAQTPRQVEVGQRVSLSDENWPSHIGLIIGEIIAVEYAEQSPLRQVVTVKPYIDTRRVGSVLIRVPEGNE